MVLDGKVLLVDTAGNVVMQMGRVDPTGENERADRRNEASTVQETGEAVNSSSSIIDSAWIQEHVQHGADGTK